MDCWSLGVLLYTLVYGSMPFQGGDYNRLVKQITEGQFIIPRERSGAFGLIKKCLCIKAAKRASIDDIAEHWWINVGYALPARRVLLVRAWRRSHRRASSWLRGLTKSKYTHTICRCDLYAKDLLLLFLLRSVRAFQLAPLAKNLACQHLPCNYSKIIF